MSAGVDPLLLADTTPARSRQRAQALAALASGGVFGFGLALAGMIDPRKVLGFLDLAGAWDASLLLVLGGAVIIAAAGFRLVLRRRAPLLDAQFHLPPGGAVDFPLLLGAALFGVGWGISGYCPGPALASLAYLNPEAFWFVPALLAGAAVQRWQTSRRG
jgi:hypothetical protein